MAMNEKMLDTVLELMKIRFPQGGGNITMMQEAFVKLYATVEEAVSITANNEDNKWSSVIEKYKSGFTNV